MQRTQISLNDAERRLLDREAKRTGKSIAALIRDAVTATYGSERSVDDDLAALRGAAGAWKDRDFDGVSYVEALRSGRRLRDVL